MKKALLFFILLLPIGAFAADVCSTSAYQVIESGDCPAGYKEIGTIEDSCPAGTKEFGTITEYTVVGSDAKGTYNCSI
jgi:hypothetical protein